jgi:hypothetical protein
MILAQVVYALCALTSAACAVLLWRGYRHSRVRLLFWSALCFAAFMVNNLILFANARILPAHDLSVVRAIPSLIGMALLLYGLIWEAER